MHLGPYKSLKGLPHIGSVVVKMLQILSFRDLPSRHYSLCNLSEITPHAPQPTASVPVPAASYTNSVIPAIPSPCYTTAPPNIPLHPPSQLYPFCLRQNGSRPTPFTPTTFPSTKLPAHSYSRQSRWSSTCPTQSKRLPSTPFPSEWAVGYHGSSHSNVLTKPWTRHVIPYENPDWRQQAEPEIRHKADTLCDLRCAPSLAETEDMVIIAYSLSISTIVFASEPIRNNTHSNRSRCILQPQVEPSTPNDPFSGPPAHSTPNTNNVLTGIDPPYPAQSTLTKDVALCFAQAPKLWHVGDSRFPPWCHVHTRGSSTKPTFTSEGRDLRCPRQS